MKLYTARMVPPLWGVAAIVVIMFSGWRIGSANADTTYAQANGDWSSIATWTNIVPGANDNAIIGNADPASAAATATVTLSQNSSASVVNLGYGTGAVGNLDLNSFNLTTGYLYLNNTSSILRTGGGSLTVSSTLYQASGSLSLAPTDKVNTLEVANGSTVTTAALQNLTNYVTVEVGGTLTLGANLNLPPVDNTPANGTLSLNGSLNCNGYAITAGTAYLGSPYSGPTAVSNHGPLTVGSLYAYAQNSPALANFTLNPGDNIANLYLYGVSTVLPVGATVGNLSIVDPTFTSSVTTTAVGNLTGSVTIRPGNTLTLGADLQLSSSATLDLGGTLNAGGHAVAAGTVVLGKATDYALDGRGPITAGTLSVSSQFSPSQTTFNLIAGDAVKTLILRGVNTTLPAGISVQSLQLSSNGAMPPTYSAARTSAAGNITNLATVDSGCTLTLGANLSTGAIELNGTLNANGHAINAVTIGLGGQAGSAAIQNDGLITATQWSEAGASQVKLHNPGDTFSTLSLTKGSALTVGDAIGQASGLTLTIVPRSSLSVDATSDLMLEVNGDALGWILRWGNPSGTTNHIADLQTFINNGEITFSYLNGGSYSLSADSSYTYVNVIPVPEPSTLLLTAAAGGLIAMRRRR